MTALEVLQKAFGESVTPVFSNGIDKNVSELIKYTNYVSVRKNQSNECIKYLNKSNMKNSNLYASCISKEYEEISILRKLNITK